MYSKERRSAQKIFVLPRKDANIYKMLIALYLLINQALIRGLVIGSLVRVI